MMKLNQNSKRHCYPVPTAVLFAFIISVSTCEAQVLRVRPGSGTQLVTHTMQQGPQAFTAVRWDIQNAAFGNGCVVQWTADRFRLQQSTKYSADCELNLQLVRGTVNSQWVVTASRDASSIATGKQRAVVSAASQGRGNAQADIVVRFLTPTADQLVAGDYQTTLIGTISGF